MSKASNDFYRLVSKNLNFVFVLDDDRTKCFSAVVGCKSDLTSDREVNSDKGQELAIRLGAQYYECSAKSGENIDNIFHGISNSILGHQVFFIQQ
jgi:hypothetical protein